jgi:predicted PurR-regulated permease PerM
MVGVDNDRAARGDDRVRWVLLAATAILLAPLAPAVMLALWLSGFARIVHDPLTRLLRGRVRLAAALTVVALTLVLIPFVLALTSLALDAYDLVGEVSRSSRGKEVLEQLVARKGPDSSLWDVVLGQQERAWSILQQIAGTATRVVIGLVVIVAGIYAVLVDGRSWYEWVEGHAPVSPALVQRLRDAFVETGRGLFIGIGAAGLAQASVATVAYLALRIPHPLELGLITFCFSVIPAVGTAIVWVPVAIGLALTGRDGAAIILAVCGIAVIGTIDNLVRPFLTRRGRLQLPTYVVLVSMFAGVMVIGAWGLLVAPLAVRWVKAVLERDVDRPPEPSR